MRISEQTLVLLARGGCEDAIRVLGVVENETAKSLLETEFHFQPGPGIFHTSALDSRKRTVLGMPAMTPERLSTLVGPDAERA